jgi:hypothetical protein
MEIMIPPRGMKPQNLWIWKWKWKLVEQFGSKCEECEEDDPQKLEFAHKAGFRVRIGGNRGKNQRIMAVKRNPEQFRLLCRPCHTKYDNENPLTDDEKRKDKDKIPF